MNIVDKIERLLLNEFENVPFHNLLMLNNIQNNDLSLGGTCSDKVLGFKAVLLNNNILSKLHSSFINDIECHRMLSVTISGRMYYIDVGSGWPSLKLIPDFEEIEYTVYGMSFKTKIKVNEIVLYHKTKVSKEYNKMVVIPRYSKQEQEILLDIENRFTDISIYPFQNSIRFSIVKDNCFYFIKGDRLRIYSNTDLTEISLKEKQVYDFIENNFNPLVEFMEAVSTDEKP